MSMNGKTDGNQGSMEAVGRVAHSVVHDLNNLLTVVVAYAAAGRTQDNPAELKEALRQIGEAAECATKLLRSVLAIDGTPGYERVSTNLNDEVKQLMPVMQTLVRNRAKLTFLPLLDLDTVLVDSAHMSQVILNLVVNAAEAVHGSGSHIWLWSENVSVPDDDAAVKRGGALGGPFVCLHVRDTGPGIDPDVVEQMFDQGYSTKGSTGTGLATVKRIVAYYGGFLVVDSAPGRGTRISVYLPRHERAGKIQREQDTGTEPGFRRRQSTPTEARAVAS